MRGVTLGVGQSVVLALDGTLVYVEDIQPTFALVVALPEQMIGRKDERVFTPGSVRAKKISPFSSAERVIAPEDLSERNLNFCIQLADLREEHGPNHIARTPEEIAAMSVVKAGPAPRVKRDATEAPGAKKNRRAEKRAAAKLLTVKCATCGEQRGHFNHPKEHEFVLPAEPVVPASTKGTQPDDEDEDESSAKGGSNYTLVSEDLTAAKAQPRGEKFNDGNRSHRVVVALASLPGKAGTIDEVVRALLADGNNPPANPQKVVRRTLNQLATAAFGSVVTRA